MHLLCVSLATQSSAFFYLAVGVHNRQSKRLMSMRLPQVYEGERLFARDNTLIGRFLLDNLECGSRGEEVMKKVSR